MLRHAGKEVVTNFLLRLLRFSRGSIMKPMSFSESIFLFFLALIIFGPKKLPEIARQVGKVLNEFRRASNEFKAQIEQEIAHLEVEERKKTILPPTPPPENTASRSLSPTATVSELPAEANPEEPKSAESGNGAAPATLAAPPEGPAAAVSGEIPASEAVAPSQESHA